MREARRAAAGDDDEEEEDDSEDSEESQSEEEVLSDVSDDTISVDGESGPGDESTGGAAGVQMGRNHVASRKANKGGYQALSTEAEAEEGGGGGETSSDKRSPAAPAGAAWEVSLREEVLKGVPRSHGSGGHGGFLPGQPVGKLSFTFGEIRQWFRLQRIRRRYQQCQLAVDRHERVLKDLEAQVLAMVEREREAAAGDGGALKAFEKKQASGVINPLVKRQTQALKDCRERLMACSEELESAEAAWSDVVGPRPLQKLVLHRRRMGFPLPFRLDFQKNSRFAKGKFDYR